MQEFTFQALGTHWSITVDQAFFDEGAQAAILGFVSDFEKRFSRFLPGSEANAFRLSSPGEYPVSEECSELLLAADRLRSITDGAYDPAIGSFLEDAGYGGQGMAKIIRPQGAEPLPKWSFRAGKAVLDGPIVFDFGGIGKGYCIDRVADLLRRMDYPHFIVDGGGDMMVSSKADGSPWRVAIEYPGRPGMAAGTILLAHQGLAVSDGFRRRFGTWHHLVHSKEKRPIEAVIGCAAVARDAFSADCMTSVLFFATPEKYQDGMREFDARFLVFQDNKTVKVSQNWEGELF